IFDLLTLRGTDLTRETLEQRRRLLRTKVMPHLPDSILYSETLEASTGDLIEVVREQGFEGIVAKRPDSLYEPRQAIWRLAENARPPITRSRNRGLYTGRPEFRWNPCRLLRGTQTHIRREGARRLHAGAAERSIQE